MTNPKYSHIAVVVDRSGSMSRLATDMRGALDEFFKAQAVLPGVCLVDYVQFDHDFELVFEDTHVSLAKAQLQPRGSTALLDAIGKTVVNLGEKLAAKTEAERPGTVQVVVVTDGHENASREWTNGSIKELIQEQESKWNWDFVFLGANMDAVAVGESFGFRAGNSMTYDTGNTVAMASAVSNFTTRSRSGLDASFTDEERAAQKV